MKETYFDKRPELERFRIQKDAAEVAREIEIVLRACLSMARDDGLQHASAVVDALVALHRR